MSGLTLIGRIWQTSKHYDLWEIAQLVCLWVTFVSSYWLIQMEAYISRGHFIDNLKYDWLMIMSLDGADHET